MRILIVKPSALGDIVHALPFLVELRRRYSSAHIGWVVKREWAPLLEGHPCLDEVIPMDFSLGGFRTGVGKIRAEKYDLVIDLQGLIRSGFLSILSGAKTRIGFERSACREPLNSLFTNREIRISENIHVVDKNTAILGLSGGVPDLRFTVRPEDEDAAGEVTRNCTGPIVGIHPGVGAEVKAWSLERFSVLADRLLEEERCAVVLFGGRDSEWRMDSIMEAMKGKPVRAPFLPLKTLCAFLGKCRVVVSADSGPLHMAAAMGTGTVGLYGPSDPARVAPRGENVVLLKKPCSCPGPKGVYFNRNCVERTCMKSLEGEEVFNAVQTLLGEDPRRAEEPVR